MRRCPILQLEKPDVLPLPQSLPQINFSCQKKHDENKSFTNNL